MHDDVNDNKKSRGDESFDNASISDEHADGSSAPKGCRGIKTVNGCTVFKDNAGAEETNAGYDICRDSCIFRSDIKLHGEENKTADGDEDRCCKRCVMPGELSLKPDGKGNNDYYDKPCNEFVYGHNASPLCIISDFKVPKIEEFFNITFGFC